MDIRAAHVHKVMMAVACLDTGIPCSIKGVAPPFISYIGNMSLKQIKCRSGGWLASSRGGRFSTAACCGCRGRGRAKERYSSATNHLCKDCEGGTPAQWVTQHCCCIKGVCRVMSTAVIPLSGIEGVP